MTYEEWARIWFTGLAGSARASLFAFGEHPVADHRLMSAVRPADHPALHIAGLHARG